MSLHILITIIIPAYNSGKFIANTLFLLLEQELENCEVIVIDDGSTDNTVEIVQIFIKKDNHIKLITIPHSGVSVARNTGIQHAKGKYVCFLDSDDFYTHDTINYFKKVIFEHQEIDVITFGHEIQRNGKRVNRRIALKYDNCCLDSGTFLSLFFLRIIKNNCMSCIIKIALIKTNKLEFNQSKACGEDLEFSIKLFSCAKKIYYTARVCYIYQIRADSLMHKPFNVDRLNAVFVVNHVVENTINEYQNAMQNAYFFVANMYVVNLYHYLRSETKSAVINQSFIDNKKILYKEHVGTFLRMLLIGFVKIIPLKLLFLTFHKY
jgi:glycosyltransferase involved in cell wall biosynthesis